MEEYIPYTGELMGGNPCNCKGNGTTRTQDGSAVYECCCDECDYFLDCFPNWRELAGDGSTPENAWSENGYCEQTTISGQ